jgi:hypothetical protein
LLSAVQRIYGSEEVRLLVKPSSSAIKAQAGLIKASKVAKEWADKTTCIYRSEGCTHSVLPFYTLGNEIVPKAYYKRGRDQGIIEKIVWDIAVIFGWEELFTATKLETVYLQKIQYVVDRSVRQDHVYRLERGSLQKAITGKLLHGWKGEPPINHISLCRAFAAMFILGLNDVHGKNIFVQGDGSVKLFDNGKCLPPGNRFIIGGENLYPVHRFSPLNLKESKLPLDEEHLAAMKQMIQSCRLAWPALEQFFSSKIMKTRGLKLPSHWLNVGASLKTMGERIKVLDQCLEAAQGKSLEDLMINAYPEYKFTFVLSMLYAKSRGMNFTDNVDKALAFYHSTVGGISLFETFSYCYEMNYNIMAIYRKAKDPSTTLRQLIACCLLPVDEFVLKDTDDVESILEFLRLRKWLQATFGDIPRDHKCAPEKDPEYHSLGEVLNLVAEDFLFYRGFKKINKGSKSSLDKQKQKPKSPVLFYPEDEKKEYVVFKDGSYRTLEDMDVTLSETSSLDLEPS